MNASTYKAATADALAKKVVAKLPKNARTARSALRRLVDLARDSTLRLEAPDGDFMNISPDDESGVYLEIGHQCVIVSGLRRKVPMEFLTLALVHVVDEAGSVEEFIRKQTQGWHQEYVDQLLAQVGPLDRWFAEHHNSKRKAR